MPEVLPYMEQQEVYNNLVAWLRANAAGNRPWSTGASGGIAAPTNQYLPSIICPSEITKKPGAGANTYTSYHCNRGDIPMNWDWSERRGPFVRGDTSGTSTLPPVDQTTAMADIRDGTSKTIMLGEVCVGQDTNDIFAGHGSVGAGALPVTAAPRATPSSERFANFSNGFGRASPRPRRRMA
jgi:hypothetical protein